MTNFYCRVCGAKGTKQTMVVTYRRAAYCMDEQACEQRQADQDKHTSKKEAA